MTRKRNRITAEMSQTIAESSPLIKKTKKDTHHQKSYFVGITRDITMLYLERISIKSFKFFV